MSFAFVRYWKNCILSLAKNNVLFFHVLLRLTQWVKARNYHQRLWKNHFEKEFLSTLRAPFVVMQGLFKGLEYPTLESYGSELAPKILGTYEYEIQDHLKRFLNHSPKHILDIGCAEGYYAVGIGKLLPDSTVLAFDISSKAISLCKELASRNKVVNIQYKKKCDASFLSTFSFQKNDLIICDTEGYEWVLFDEKNAANMFQCHLIIELHDTRHKNLPSLLHVFEKTHDTTIVTYEGRSQFHHEVLVGLGHIKKSYLLSECRSGILHEGKQEWLILQPRNSVK